MLPVILPPGGEEGSCARRRGPGWFAGVLKAMKLPQLGKQFIGIPIFDPQSGNGLA